MLQGIESQDLSVRMRSAVSLAWSILARKIGGGLIEVNKEASLQLQFAYVLQQIMPLITFHKEEELTLELETSAKVGASTREIDVFFKGEKDGQEHRIAIEMKCYRKYASSGKLRGATDVFMKDVYDDLAILERYVENHHAEEGVCLVMTDHKQLVAPEVFRKDAKWRHYEISHGFSVGPRTVDVPIGGQTVFIELKRHYRFSWEDYGGYFFLETEGISVSEETPSQADVAEPDLVSRV